MMKHAPRQVTYGSHVVHTGPLRAIAPVRVGFLSMNMTRCSCSSSDGQLDINPHHRPQAHLFGSTNDSLCVNGSSTSNGSVATSRNTQPPTWSRGS